MRLYVSYVPITPWERLIATMTERGMHRRGHTHHKHNVALDLHNAAVGGAWEVATRR